MSLPNFSTPPPGFQGGSFGPNSGGQDVPGSGGPPGMPLDGNQEVWVETKAADGKVNIIITTLDSAHVFCFSVNETISTISYDEIVERLK